MKFLSLFVLLFSFQSFAEDNPYFNQQDCVEDQCVIFQVTVKIDNQVETPAAPEVTDSVIYIGGEPNSYRTAVKREGDTCTKEVRVPNAVFNSITQIMRSMAGDQGDGPIPVLTPAQQTILLFYTTLMQQTLSFDCKKK